MLLHTLVQNFSRSKALSRPDLVTSHHFWRILLCCGFKEWLKFTRCGVASFYWGSKRATFHDASFSYLLHAVSQYLFNQQEFARCIHSFVGNPGCGATISSCARASLWPLALRLLAVARQQRQPLADSSCNAAISACVRVAAWSRALRILQVGDQSTNNSS